MKQKYIVTIAGMTFNVVSEDDENFTNDVARTVNMKINNLVLTTTNCTKMKAAALCAMDYCSESKKLAAENQLLNEKIKRLERELALAKCELKGKDNND